MVRSSRWISALPRAVTSRSLTPSMRSASMRCDRGRHRRFGGRGSGLRGCCAPARGTSAAPASRAEAAWSRRSFCRLCRIFNDTRRCTAQWIAGCSPSSSAWLGAQLRAAPFTLAPASADASFRRYFRATLADGRSYIAMDAPPEQGGLPPVRARRAHAARGRRARAAGPGAGPRAGLPAAYRPRHTTYLDVLSEDNAAARCSPTRPTRCCAGSSRRAPGELPPYDEALLRRELDLFPDWYVARASETRACRRRKREALRRAFAAAGAERARAAGGLRAPRLHAAQPDGVRAQPRHARLPGRGATGRSPTTWCRCCATRSSAGRRSRCSTGRVRYWEKAKRAGLPVARGFRRVLARLRVDGAAAPSQGARHLRAPQLPRRQAAATSRTRRASSTTRAGVCRALPASWRRSRACSTSCA